jgi:FMN phosphatase YigB (HAD superfamily)
MKLPITSIVFDLGDVLFNWSCDATSIPKETLRDILTSDTWKEYECGRPKKEEECYSKISSERGVSKDAIADALTRARDSLTPDAGMFQLIKNLKATHEGLKIFAMSNISTPDWTALQPKLDATQWALFDARFPSCEAGLRKPKPEFFHHVILEAKLNPKSTVFVDDNASNIETAKELGFHAIQFKNRDQAAEDLLKLFEYSDAVARARQYLDANKKQHLSVTSPLTEQHHDEAIANGMKTSPVSVTSGTPINGDGIVIGDNFASLLLLEATKDPELVDIEECQQTWNFFTGGKLLPASPQNHG